MRKNTSRWWVAGYDLRKPSEVINHTEKRSVDPCIWPSILEEICHKRGIAEAYEQQSNWINLAQSLEELLGLVPDADKLGIIVEISYPKNAISTLSCFLGLSDCINNTERNNIIEKTLIGFDVSDPRTLTSAIYLMCGKNRIFEEELTNTIFGLFKELKDADRLAKIASTRCPEHAPFFITKLMQVYLPNVVRRNRSPNRAQ